MFFAQSSSNVLFHKIYLPDEKASLLLLSDMKKNPGLLHPGLIVEICLGCFTPLRAVLFLIRCRF